MAENKKKKSLRFDWPYHFVTVPLLMIVFIWSIVHLIQSIGDEEQISLAILLVLISIVLSIGITRVRVYATKTQDRIVRTEEQFRYFRLTGRTLNPKLNIAQIIALRNSGDDEFPALSERAAAENMSPAQIRSEIKNRRADTMRI